MGFHVAAIDVDDAKVKLATEVGAELVVNATQADPGATLKRELRGAHGVLVTAASRSAFSQAIGMLHKRGTMLMVGRQDRARVDVGTRKDLQEALAFAGEGKVHTVVTEDRIENINGILDRMRHGEIEGRVVFGLGGGAEVTGRRLAFSRRL